MPARCCAGSRIVHSGNAQFRLDVHVYDYMQRQLAGIYALPRA